MDVLVVYTVITMNIRDNESAHTWFRYKMNKIPKLFHFIKIHDLIGCLILS